MPPAAEHPAAPASSEARYLARLDDLEQAARTLHAELGYLIRQCEAVRGRFDEGRSALEVVTEVGERGRAFRRQLHASARRFDSAMQMARGESFRILLDDGESSITEVARVAGLSVQMVRRLVETVDPL